MTRAKQLVRTEPRRVPLTLPRPAALATVPRRGAVAQHVSWRHILEPQQIALLDEKAMEVEVLFCSWPLVHAFRVFWRAV